MDRSVRLFAFQKVGVELIRLMRSGSRFGGAGPAIEMYAPAHHTRAAAGGGRSREPSGDNASDRDKRKEARGREGKGARGGVGGRGVKKADTGEGARLCPPRTPRGWPASGWDRVADGSGSRDAILSTSPVPKLTAIWRAVADTDSISGKRCLASA